MGCKMKDTILYWVLFVVFLEFYFVVRGRVEGMVFSPGGIDAGQYHLFRLLETVLVVAALFVLKPDLMVLVVAFWGLAFYEIHLSLGQFGVFPPREPFVYRFLVWDIFVTPTGKLLLVILYFVLGGVFLILREMGG